MTETIIEHIYLSCHIYPDNPADKLVRMAVGDLLSQGKQKVLAFHCTWAEIDVATLQHLSFAQREACAIGRKICLIDPSKEITDKFSNYPFLRFLPIFKDAEELTKLYPDCKMHVCSFIGSRHRPQIIPA